MPLEQVIGLSFIDGFVPEDRPLVEQLLREARSGRAKREFRLGARDGTIVPVYLSTSLFSIEGRPALCGVVTDLTDQKRAEEVAATDKAKDRFLAMLSHELRTPLNPVMASVQLLEMDQSLPPDVHDSLAMIRRNVELEVRLIDDLLDLTKVRQGKVPLKCESVDAHAAVKGALEINQSEIRDKQLSVSVVLGAEQHWVWAEPARLQQIFWNLLKNAVKFTPDSGQISITSKNVDGMLFVQVSDSGIGIEPDALPKLFDAFEQADPTILRRFGGLGLGLTISKALAEMHDGKLGATSDGMGKGAEFTLELPTIQHDQPGEVVPIEKNLEEGLGRRILLVDDHPDTLRVMVRLLKMMGYVVSTAASVREALEIAATGKFDLLISDVGLPDGSGIDLMKQVRSQYGLGGIAVSGFGQDEDLRRSKEAGFSAHLIKPLSFNALQVAIGEAMA